MKALCPETGTIPVTLRPWIPWFGETTVRYAHADAETKAKCTVRTCPVKSCTRKIHVSHGADFVTVLARRAKTDILQKEQQAAEEEAKLEAEVIRIMHDRGMV